MKRGFSVTTAILVALLLGVLVMVGKIVNPPSAAGDHDHSEEQAPSPPPKPVSKEQQIAMQKQQQQKMMAEMKKHQPPPLPKGQAAPVRKKDPLDASLWQEHDMGAVTPKPEPSTVTPNPTTKPTVSTDTPKINAAQ